MPTTRDVQAQQRAEAGWAFDPDQIKVEVPAQLDPKSSAARIAAQVREDERELAADRDQLVDQLQAQRKEHEKTRRRTRGLSTAEILAGQVRR